jgi:hypothetical protein
MFVISLQILHHAPTTATVNRQCLTKDPKVMLKRDNQARTNQEHNMISSVQR